LLLVELEGCASIVDVVLDAAAGLADGPVGEVVAIVGVLLR
jgi:hypothetical protein